MVSHVNSRGTLVPGCSTPIARVVLCTVTAGRVTYESVSVWKRTHCAPEQLATMGERGLSHMTSYMCTIMCGNGQSVRRLAKRPAPPNLMGQPRHCVDAVRRLPLSGLDEGPAPGHWNQVGPARPPRTAFIKSAVDRAHRRHLLGLAAWIPSMRLSRSCCSVVLACSARGNDTHVDEKCPRARDLGDGQDIVHLRPLSATAAAA